MINDNLELTGALTISINNNVVQDTDNLVVTVGRQWVSNRLRDAVSATTAGAFVVGVSYTIVTVGSTDFTAIGASANTVGIVFTATAVGSGTGTATAHAQKAQMTHMAVGTDGTTAAAANTALLAEIAGGRNTLGTAGGTVTTNTIVYVATWAAGDGTGAIKEAGIFNASTAGDMFARTDFPVVNKGADDSMTITWTITVS